MMTKEERRLIAREAAWIVAGAVNDAEIARAFARLGMYAVREDDDGLSAVGMELPAEASL